MILASAESVRKNYHIRDVEVQAVRSVSLTLEQGEIVGLTGRSGSGKTTLLAMLAGLLTPTSGSVRINGTDLVSLDEGGLAAFRNRHIGFVPQGGSLVASLTVLDNVRLPHYLSPREGGIRERAEALLGELGIIQLAFRYPPQLSGGETRRVAIARAFANSPDLVIADEPTGDLDEESIALVLRFFRAAREAGTTILFSTHEKEAERAADRVYAMREGELACRRE